MKRALLAVILLAICSACYGQGSAIPHPMGLDSYVQYNNGGVFGGDATFNFNDTTKVLDVDGLTITGTIATGLDMSGGTFATAVQNWPATPVINVAGVQTIKFDDTNHNVLIGTSAFANDEGDHIVGLGWHAGYNNNTDDVTSGIDGTSNVYIGVRAGAGETKLTGTVTLTQGSDSVVGAGTLFTAEVVIGDIIRFHEVKWIYEVTAVDDNTHLTIASNFTDITTVGRWATIERGANNGNENVAIGTLVLVMNTTGYENAAIGDNCLQWNTTGHNNTALGNDALQWNTEGNFNTALGADTLYYNTTGYGNTTVGYQALFTSTASNYNVGIGFQAGYNDSGDNNLFVGYQSGYLNDTTGAGAEGDYNVYVGNQSGYGATAATNNTGNTNVGIGSGTLYKNTSGYGNIAIGRNSMRENTSGWYSVAIGAYSLDASITGNQNVAIGYAAGSSLISGADNIYIGYRAGFNQTTLSDILIIDNQDRGSAAAEITDSLMYGVFNATVASQTLRINANVAVGATPSTAGLQMGDDKLIAVDTNAGLTASTTQTQGQGALTAQVNEISTVANDDDTVTLPTAVTGVKVEIVNNGANTLQIFPSSGDDLGLGVNVAEELMANESVGFVAYDTTNWAKESTTEIIHAEIHDEDNTDAFVINDAGGDFHSYHTNGLAAGDLADWTFDAGGAGTSFPIASVANSAGSPGTQILVTTTGAHGLAVGDIISQTNLADAAYVGVFEVVATAAATTYEVTAAYTATGTGTMDQAATLTADAVAAGAYSFAYYMSGTPVGNNETFDFQLYREATAVTGSKIRRKFGAANDFGSMSGGGVVTIANGDKVSLALSNEDSAANVILRNVTIVLIRL